MSNMITSMCRPLRMSPAQKSVLMCIADFAHDDGADWHSQAAIAEWTCLSKRAVIDAIAWLEAEGFIQIDRRIGAKSRTVLQIDRIEAAARAGGQCASRTGADAAPVQEAHQCTTRTGADAASDLCSSRTTTSADAAPTGAAAAPEALQASEKHQQHQVTAGGLAPDLFDAGDVLVARKRTTRKGRALDQSATGPTWAAYAAAFSARYGIEPTRGPKVNGQLTSLVRELGAAEAPRVAAFYVQSDRSYYVEKCHDLGPLLADARTLRTQLLAGVRPASPKKSTHAGFAGKNYREGVASDGSFT